MIWRLRNGSVNLSRSGLIMGVLNVTPDSFSDGGRFVDEEASLRHAECMANEGATILDIGGESSRPRAEPVALKEELRRVIPVIQRIRKQLPGLYLSIDTYKAETARQAIAAGADIINDISALRADPEMMEVVQYSEVGVILMHMLGTPKTMQINPHYDDVVAEVFEFLRRRQDELLRSGVDRDRIAIDPGFGFGKRVQHNVELVRHLGRFAQLDRPIVVGLSRKSVIAHLLHDSKLQSEDRMWPTVALTSLLREKGGHIFRVHDVRPNHEALRMTEAILFND
ncbi:MAG: dihydropteroate synthase [Verrucomicrobia bacterium]|nr:dihydropteroate synthase [Verrucomicrobiota bacterium]